MVKLLLIPQQMSLFSFFRSFFVAVRVLVVTMDRDRGYTARCTSPLLTH